MCNSFGLESVELPLLKEPVEKSTKPKNREGLCSKTKESKTQE